MWLVITTAPCSAAMGDSAIEAVVDIEGKALVDVVALLPAWARTRGCSKVWEELGSEAFAVKVTLDTGGKPSIPPLAWTPTTKPQQPASSIRYFGLPSIKDGMKRVSRRKRMDIC